MLGHRRLSIIDTSDAGTQPMASGDGRYVLTYNGELYNFEELRPALAAAGVNLRGRTDTEVLLEALALWGVDALKRFDGMFAFALFDTLTGDILLARDAFGEKPLYYTRLRNGSVAFASELQALERAPGFDARVSTDAMAEMLTFQYIGAPRSIYNSVRKLRPGSWMRIEPSGRTTSGRYFEFKPGETGFSDRPMGDLADELEELLATSLRRRLVADVPLGAFLSGGVDSATTCALIAAKLGRPLMTFSMGFKDAPESELHTAQLFAEHLRTDHHAAVLSPDVAQFLAGIGEILDEPNGDSSCLPTYMLSQYARQHVTVAMSGDGGDEMFAGYGRYFNTLAGRTRYLRGEAPGWRPGWNYYGSSILVAGESEIERLFGFIPHGFADHLALLRTQVDERDERLLCELRRTDVENYLPGAVLPKVDRMSMQNSLEVRTPFLSVELARFAERLPDSVLVGDRGKLILREVAYRYLPRALIDLPKQGFALPMSDWARTDLLKAARTLLDNSDSRLRAVFGSEGIAHFLEHQGTLGQFSPYQMWGVVTLESWLRAHPVELESKETGGKARLSSHMAEPATFVLRATPVDPTLFLVARVDAASDQPPSARSVHPDLMIRAIELSQPAAGNEPVLPPIDLDDWGQSGARDRDATAARLRGATLIFVDADAALRFGFEETERMRALGVARIVFRKPYGIDEVLELEFRSHRGTRRARAMATLFRRRTVLLSKRIMPRLLPRSRRFVASKTKALQSGLLRAVDAIPDRELSSRYMAFEGMRQLPPVLASHASIAEDGDGRYSVFDQTFTVAPTDSHGARAHTYWLVEADAQTWPHLPIAAKEERLARLDHADVQQLLARQHASELAVSAVLVPGDPVVVCTHALSPGGAERQWVYLAQALHRAGYDVTFVVYRSLDGDAAHYLPTLIDAGIPVVDASELSILEQIALFPKTAFALAMLRTDFIPDRDKVLALTAAFVKIRPKAVLSQLDEPNLFAAFACEVTGVARHVMSFRNYNPTNFAYLNKDWYREAYRLLANRPGCVLSGNHSDANRDYAVWLGRDPAEVRHVPNVIDPGSFPPADATMIEQARRLLRIPKGAPVLLGAFRLSAEKDPLTFVNTCALVLDIFPDAVALLAGVGPFGPKVQERIEELGMGDRIRLLGSRSDVNVLLALATICLLTSVMEGTPNILMEAQLMAKPIVATRVGGVPEIVVDGVTAVLCEAGDARGLADACLALLRDPEHAAAMGEAGARHVRQNFPRSRLAGDYLALLGVAASASAGADQTAPIAA